jgi:integrase
MAVYRPKYTDKKTGALKQSKTWRYKFRFNGNQYDESAQTTTKTLAKAAETDHRRNLERGFTGTSEERTERILKIAELAPQFMEDYKIRHPKSAKFAEYAIGHVSRLLGDLMAIEVTDRRVIRYQTDRLKEKAAPKTINEEIGFLLRLLPLLQSGAIRAQLKQQKKLKLAIGKTVGKAYSLEEKAGLVHAAKNSSRSSGIYMATMLAFHAGLRDKEIRTLQWFRFDLGEGMITVGESKTDAGTGRRIPMNEDLFQAATRYAAWYAERFGEIQPEWYVFPFGRARGKDMTRPQTTLKTAWRGIRTAADVVGRFHDTRHTFVTDLAESGAGDEIIRDMAGHVSKDMLKHYSHIRTEAKRKAVQSLSIGKPKRLVQDMVQGGE